MIFAHLAEQLSILLARFIQLSLCLIKLALELGCLLALPEHMFVERLLLGSHPEEA